MSPGQQLRRQILFSSVAPQDAEPETILKKLIIYSMYKEGAVIVNKKSTKKVSNFVEKKFVNNKFSLIMCCESIVHCLTTNGFKYARKRFIEMPTFGGEK